MTAMLLSQKNLSESQDHDINNILRLFNMTNQVF